MNNINNSKSNLNNMPHVRNGIDQNDQILVTDSISNNPDKLLNAYIYDYLIKSGLGASSKAFFEEANLPISKNGQPVNKATLPAMSQLDSPPKLGLAMDSPHGFLLEWWEIFWEMFNAKSNRQVSQRSQLYYGLEQQKRANNLMMMNMNAQSHSMPQSQQLQQQIQQQQLHHHHQQQQQQQHHHHPSFQQHQQQPVPVPQTAQHPQQFFKNGKAISNPLLAGDVNKNSGSDMTFGSAGVTTPHSQVGSPLVANTPSLSAPQGMTLQPNAFVPQKLQQQQQQQQQQQPVIFNHHQQFNPQNQGMPHQRSPSIISNGQQSMVGNANADLNLSPSTVPPNLQRTVIMQNQLNNPMGPHQSPLSQHGGHPPQILNQHGQLVAAPVGMSPQARAAIPGGSAGAGAGAGAGAYYNNNIVPASDKKDGLNGMDPKNDDQQQTGSHHSTPSHLTPLEQHPTPKQQQSLVRSGGAADIGDLTKPGGPGGVPGPGDAIPDAANFNANARNGQMGNGENNNISILRDYQLQLIILEKQNKKNLEIFKTDKNDNNIAELGNENDKTGMKAIDNGNNNGGNVDNNGNNNNNNQSTTDAHNLNGNRNLGHPDELNSAITPGTMPPPQNTKKRSSQVSSPALGNQQIPATGATKKRKQTRKKKNAAGSEPSSPADPMTPTLTPGPALKRKASSTNAAKKRDSKANAKDAASAAGANASTAANGKGAASSSGAVPNSNGINFGPELNPTAGNKNHEADLQKNLAATTSLNNSSNNNNPNNQNNQNNNNPNNGSNPGAQQGGAMRNSTPSAPDFNSDTLLDFGNGDNGFDINFYLDTADWNVNHDLT